MPYGTIELSQHWLRWQRQAITWTNIDLLRGPRISWETEGIP